MGGSHPRKSNLRTFLKKEIQKRRLKAPEIDPLDASDCTPTDGNMRAGVDHQLALQNSADNSILGSPANSMYGREDSDFSSQSGDPIDNLFGEPLGTPSLREQELQRLLAEHNPIVPVAKFTESSKLKDLKDELKVVILLETDGNTSIREHALIQRQKGSLIEEIRYMGEVERRVFEKSRTKNKSFPEPISNKEKQQIEWRKRHLERARNLEAAPSCRQPKRTQEEVDNENALDGEERLRLGKPIKRHKIEMTGRFPSRS